MRRTASGKWKARFRGPDGKLHSKVFYRKQDAQDWRAEQKIAARKNTWVDPSLGRMTLAQFWPRFVEATPNLGESTRDLYEREWRLHTQPYLGKRRLDSIKRLDVEAWIAELGARGCGASTIEHAFRVLRRILSAAVDADILARNPASGAKVPKPEKRHMRFLTDAELGTPPRLSSAVTGRSFSSWDCAGLGSVRPSPSPWRT